MTRKIIADLHNHSTASDGEYSPKEFVEKAASLHLEAIALTDHDSLRGLDETLAASEKSGLVCIPAAEVTLRFVEPMFTGSLHLLLYFNEKTLRKEEFQTCFQAIVSQGRGHSLVKSRVEAINQEFGPQGKNPVLKRDLTVDEIEAFSSNVTRRHFALALKENHGLSDKSVISQLIANDSPAYIPSGIDMELLKPLLEEFSVLVVLAHPAAGSYPGKSHYSEVLPPLETVRKLLPRFLELGIDGIEVHYPGHTSEHREILKKWADEYNLCISGGSDCHDAVQRPTGIDGLTSGEWDSFYQAFLKKTE